MLSCNAQVCPKNSWERALAINKPAPFTILVLCLNRSKHYSILYIFFENPIWVPVFGKYICLISQAFLQRITCKEDTHRGISIKCKVIKTSRRDIFHVLYYSYIHLCWFCDRASLSKKLPRRLLWKGWIFMYLQTL